MFLSVLAIDTILDTFGVVNNKTVNLLNDLLIMLCFLYSPPYLYLNIVACSFHIWANWWLHHDASHLHEELDLQSSRTQPEVTRSSPLPPRHRASSSEERTASLPLRADPGSRAGSHW